MVTPGQEKYLARISEEELVSIQKFNPLAREVGNNIVDEIKRVLPDATVHYIGSSVLGIAGENDIDIAIVGSGQFENERESLTGRRG